MNVGRFLGRVLAVVAGWGATALGQQAAAQDPDTKVLRVRRTDDFVVNGKGDAPAWTKTAWESLHLRTADGHRYQTRVKVLYSGTGLYVLMNAEDRRITATMNEDFLDLWTEDVFEFFLWPDGGKPDGGKPDGRKPDDRKTDARQAIYFEYEISPLGFELPLLIPNLDGKFLGWRPWHYEGKRKVQKATTVTGGPKRSGAVISGWTAEVFVPYDLLAPLQNVPPQSGTRWRANFYRVDYDDGKTTGWDWARVGESFHEFDKFGTLIFD